MARPEERTHLRPPVPNLLSVSLSYAGARNPRAMLLCSNCLNAGVNWKFPQPLRSVRTTARRSRPLLAVAVALRLRFLASLPGRAIACTLASQLRSALIPAYSNICTPVMQGNARFPRGSGKRGRRNKERRR